MSKKLFCDICKTELIVPTVDNKIELDNSSTYKNELEVSVYNDLKKENYKFKFIINFEKQRILKNHQSKSKDYISFQKQKIFKKYRLKTTDYMDTDLCDICKIKILEQIILKSKE